MGHPQHCRAVTSPLPEEEGLGEKVELPLAEDTEKVPFGGMVV